MKLKKGQMITNGKGVSYYQLGKKYYRNTGWLQVEISKDEFDIEVEKAFNELNGGKDNGRK